MAFLGSVLLHGVALALFALIVAWQPPPTPKLPEDDPIKLEMVRDEPPDTPPPVIPEERPAPTRRVLVDASGPEADSAPSSDAVLADRNTRGSSLGQSDSRQSGTEQAGRKLALFKFDPQPETAGHVTQAPAATPTPLPETAPTLPQPDRSVHRPAATPAPTAAPDEFAAAMVTPTPAPEDPFDPSIRSTSPPLPKPAATAAPGGVVRTAQNGSSAVRGTGGVDTKGTPAARYGIQVKQTIGAVWTRAIDRRDDKVFGTAIIHCTITRDGLVLSPRIVRNTADVLFGAMALQAVAMARLPPMPADVVRELDGNLTMDITFDLTPLQQEAVTH